jgi:hypothetical protein
VHQVYNLTTYPHLVGFLETLGVETEPSDMSFALSIDDGKLEWGSHNLDTVFAQRKNAASPTFLRMVADVIRFGQQAPKVSCVACCCCCCCCCWPDAGAGWWWCWPAAHACRQALLRWPGDCVARCHTSQAAGSVTPVRLQVQSHQSGCRFSHTSQAAGSVTPVRLQVQSHQSGAIRPYLHTRCMPYPQQV